MSKSGFCLARIGVKNPGDTCSDPVRPPPFTYSIVDRGRRDSRTVAVGNVAAKGEILGNEVGEVG